MILLIDQGNSALKWCCYQDKFLPSYTGSVLDLVNFVKHESSQIRGGLISCVKNAEAIKSISEMLLENEISLPLQIAQTGSAYFELKNGYTISNQLGIDRWLAMIAVWHSLHRGYIVVDAGSALTLDIVDDSGQHLGGHITPGLSMQKKLLLAGTDGVNFRTKTGSLPYDLGRSTATAVHNGCISTLCAYIETMYKQNSSLPLFITGGDALKLSKCLIIDHQVMPDLVLQGLYYSSQ